MRNLESAPALPGRHQRGFFAFQSQIKQSTPSAHSLFKAACTMQELCATYEVQVQVEKHTSFPHSMLVHTVDTRPIVLSEQCTDYRVVHRPQLKARIVLALIAVPTASMTAL